MGGGPDGDTTVYNECRHIMPSGAKCHSPALCDKAYCYYHNKLHDLSNALTGEIKQVPMPPIEDDSSIKLALTQILGALNSPHMDTRRAGLMLYGLQIAAQITRRSPDATPSKTVRTLSRQRDGSELAPKQTACEPPEDCPNCMHKDECLNLTRINYRSIARILNAYRKGQDRWDEHERRVAPTSSSESTQ